MRCPRLWTIFLPRRPSHPSQSPPVSRTILLHIRSVIDKPAVTTRSTHRAVHNHARARIPTQARKEQSQMNSHRFSLDSRPAPQLRPIPSLPVESEAFRIRAQEAQGKFTPASADSLSNANEQESNNCASRSYSSYNSWITSHLERTTLIVTSRLFRHRSARARFHNDLP